MALSIFLTNQGPQKYNSYPKLLNRSNPDNTIQGKESVKVEYGVLQGSLLAPLLFSYSSMILHKLFRDSV